MPNGTKQLRHEADSGDRGYCKSVLEPTFPFITPGNQMFRMIDEPVTFEFKDLFVTRVRLKKVVPVFIKSVLFFWGRKELFKTNFAQESYRICLVIRKYGPCHDGSPYASCFHYSSTHIKLLNVNISQTLSVQK